MEKKNQAVELLQGQGHVVSDSEHGKSVIKSGFDLFSNTFGKECELFCSDSSAGQRFPGLIDCELSREWNQKLGHQVKNSNCLGLCDVDAKTEAEAKQVEAFLNSRLGCFRKKNRGEPK